ITSPIPSVPAAQYVCGGVASSLAGETDVEDLYVIGESACTGLHGASRLASNSLLECVVMAEACSQKIVNTASNQGHILIPAWDDAGIVPEQERIQIKQNWDEIRAVMSHYVGIVRSDLRLRRAKRRLLVIQEEIANFYWRHPLNRDLIELRNLALVADLMVRSAQQRHESRGLHYSTDYPQQLPVAQDTELTPE
ncbi:MAG: FAD-binding protein, partial [Mariprofundaceae bacterium]|nr:FAD-binding protein [Mariprofundaceae bacterium]